MNTHRRAQDGLTLAELLIAAAISVVIILAVGNLDVTRIALTKDVVLTTNFQAEAERLAASHLPKRLEQADRINMICDGTGSGNPACAANGLNSKQASIQIRFPDIKTTQGSCTTCPVGGIPDPCCFDIAGNYRWVQYLSKDTDGDGQPDTVRFYDDTANGCANARTLARQINALRLTYMNESQPPPGGDPFASGLDNNVIQIQVEALDPSSPGGVRLVETHVTIRAAAYTNVGAAPGGTDSGTGLEAPGLVVSPPPGLCSS